MANKDDEYVLVDIASHASISNQNKSPSHNNTNQITSKMMQTTEDKSIDCDDGVNHECHYLKKYNESTLDLNGVYFSNDAEEAKNDVNDGKEEEKADPIPNYAVIPGGSKEAFIKHTILPNVGGNKDYKQKKQCDTLHQVKANKRLILEPQKLGFDVNINRLDKSQTNVASPFVVHLLNAIIDSTLWHKIVVFNRCNAQETTTLAMSKANFICSLHNGINTYINNMELIRISNISSIWIVRIFDNIDIGISLNDYVGVTGIYLNRDDIQKEFKIPKQQYHRLDNFESHIDELVIMDPSQIMNVLDDDLSESYSESDESESIYQDTDSEQWDDGSDDECDEKVDDVDDTKYFRFKQ